MPCDRSAVAYIVHVRVVVVVGQCNPSLAGVVFPRHPVWSLVILHLPAAVCPAFSCATRLISANVMFEPRRQYNPVRQQRHSILCHNVWPNLMLAALTKWSKYRKYPVCNYTIKYCKIRSNISKGRVGEIQGRHGC